MKPEYPTPLDYPALRALWKEAFADSDEFLDGFWEAGFSPKRCRCIMEGNRAKSALYWFDCTLQGQKYAYLYAVATAEESRGQGLCTALMDDTHILLKKLGYAGAVLVPGEKSLFAFYEKRGYRVAACVDEFTCEVSEGAPIPMQALSAEEFDNLRKAYLPHGGMVQKGETTRFLESFSHFACGDGFLMAYSVVGEALICHELLGSADCSGLLRTLKCTNGRFRTPGKGKPFAMFLPLCDTAAPEYFGLALD